MNLPPFSFSPSIHTNTSHDRKKTPETSNEEKAKVKLLLNEVDTHISEVPDPYYGGAEGFEYVFTLLDCACEEIVKNQIDATR